MTTPLPPAGPATAAAVARWLGLPDHAAELVHVDQVVAGVNGFVGRFHQADASGVWAPSVVTGTVMLAARLCRRRNSPGGVDVMAELSPSYVQRNEPDAAMLLGLGSWRPPAVG